MVEHQPRHQRGKQLPGKGHLIHRLIVRTDFHVMPAPERDGKALADPATQPLGLGAGDRRIVIDVRVVACDLARRSRDGILCQIGHGKIFHGTPAQMAR